MPVEKSGQHEFDFEYGDRFGDKIEEFDPDFSKVLVRYNPEGDAELNERQTARLRQLSEWLHERRRKYLFELLVPAEPAQLRARGGEDRYDAELRPLMLEAIRGCERRRRARHLEDEGLTIAERAEIAQHTPPRGPRSVRASSSAAVRPTRRPTNGFRPTPDSRVGIGRHQRWISGVGERVCRRPRLRPRSDHEDADSYRRFIDVYEGAPAPA
jgi:hypothetical protein